jgi:hypothetical protein
VIRTSRDGDATGPLPGDVPDVAESLLVVVRSVGALGDTN